MKQKDNSTGSFDINVIKRGAGDDNLISLRGTKLSEDIYFLAEITTTDLLVDKTPAEQLDKKQYTGAELCTWASKYEYNLELVGDAPDLVGLTPKVTYPDKNSTATTLTGLIISEEGSTLLTGVGTVFTTDLAVGNIVADDKGLGFIGVVIDIISDTEIKLLTPSTVTIPATAFSKITIASTLTFGFGQNVDMFDSKVGLLSAIMVSINGSVFFPLEDMDSGATVADPDGLTTTLDITSVFFKGAKYEIGIAKDSLELASGNINNVAIVTEQF